MKKNATLNLAKLRALLKLLAQEAHHKTFTVL